MIKRVCAGLAAVCFLSAADAADLSMTPIYKSRPSAASSLDGRLKAEYRSLDFTSPGQLDQSFTGVRWMAMALSGFGLLALVLAAIGLYGVIAYRVSLRTQEIGVRMALGAGRRTIFREVVLQGLAIAIAGVVIGEVLAIPATRALASMQAGIHPGSPSTHVAAAVIWIAVAFVAC